MISFKTRRGGGEKKLSEVCRLTGEGGSVHSETFSLLPDVHQLFFSFFFLLVGWDSPVWTPVAGHLGEVIFFFFFPPPEDR